MRRLALGQLTLSIVDKALPVLRIDSELRYELGLVPRPHYAYGVGHATELAARLGHEGVTVVELGVAGGRGLLMLEAHARHYAKVHGIDVAVVGFDLGTGLPEPCGPRDLPYIWGAGFFEMDEEALRARLREARLVIGAVRDTIPAFVEELRASGGHPVGFVSFDLDFWSSTAQALELFAEVDVLLPRVTCYFDDVIGKINDVGPMLAIREFNERYDDRKIGHPFELRSLVAFQPRWADRMFEAHFFGHPAYSTRDPDRVMQHHLGA